MKLLVSIPVLYHGHIFDECMSHLINHNNVDILIGDNGSNPDVKKIIEKYQSFSNVKIIRESVNIFVNPMWNKFMAYFLDNTQYDYLIILNSDLLLQKNWSEVCKKYWEVFPDDILIPKQIPDKDFLSMDYNTSIMSAQQVNSGTAGVFITMNRKQCEMVNPIPEEILVWFGDNWVYEILRNFYKTVIPENLISYHFHGGSQTVQSVSGISEIIEQDKIKWADVVQPKMVELIEKINNK
jgi:hypothetical protein